MSVLDAAKGHFQTLLDDEMLSLEAPEWSTTIYWKPINLREQGEIQALVSDGKTDEAVAMTLILRARNQDGSKMFKRGDAFEIRTLTDPDVVARIVTAMSEDYNDEDIEKN